MIRKQVCSSESLELRFNYAGRLNASRQCDKQGEGVKKIKYEPDVFLFDQTSGMVDGFGTESGVESGLEATVQEFFEGQVQAKIELVVTFFKETKSDQAAHKGTTFEDALGVLKRNTKKVLSRAISKAGTHVKRVMRSCARSLSHRVSTYFLWECVTC